MLLNLKTMRQTKPQLPGYSKRHLMLAKKTGTGQVHSHESQRTALNYVSQILIKAEPTSLHTVVQSWASVHPDIIHTSVPPTYM